MGEANLSRDEFFMSRAIAIARRGEGLVEPNPMVGCVIVRNGSVIGEGWHQRFGGPHAEIEAIASAAAENVRKAAAYVTLEPCCHQGKTSPCTQALLEAGVSRVVAAVRDPNPAVNGRGLAALQSAGVDVVGGVLEAEAKQLIAPFRKLMTEGRPWVIAKWAMSLDGKIAAADGSSKWISGEASRRTVHQLRGRVDAIVVGRRTAQHDDPLLTARPPGPRSAIRIVVDSEAKISTDSRLVATARGAPVLLVVGPEAPDYRVEALESCGVEVLRVASREREARLLALLDALGKRRMTNVLFEGGGELLGSLFDLNAVDEVHVFIAPRLIGASGALGPLNGAGAGTIAEAAQLGDVKTERLGDDLYFKGRVSRT